MDLPFRCALCNRRFLSAAALGGHLSHHRLSESIENCELRGQIQEGKLIFGKKKNLCAICGEKFLSVNSLLGHLNSHPEAAVQSSTVALARLIVPIRGTVLDYLREIMEIEFGIDLNSPPAPA